MKNSSVCSSLFPRLTPRQASTITSNSQTQPFRRSSQRPPIVPSAVTVRTPNSRLEGQGVIQPRAFPSLKRSKAASCSQQVKRTAGGSNRTRAAPPHDGGIAALLPGSDHNALAVEPPSPCPAACPPPLPAQREGGQAAGGGEGRCEGPGCARQ